MRKARNSSRAVTLDHLAGDDIKSRHRAGSSVSLVIVSAGPGMIRFHRQRRRCPPQCLDLRFLVYQDDDSVVGWVNVEVNNVTDLQLEPRIAGDLKCPDPVGFQSIVLQNVEYRSRRRSSVSSPTPATSSDLHAPAVLFLTTIQFQFFYAFLAGCDFFPFQIVFGVAD